MPLSADKYYVLLIQSNRSGSWVLPKGGWEVDEATAQVAACREAWEEAGVISKSVNYDLGKIPETRQPSQLTAHAPRAEYHFFEATVDRLADDWPEKHKRARQWFTFRQAAEKLASRPELLQALMKSTIVKQ